MNQPVQPAYFARLNTANAEIARRKQEALEGVMAALAAEKEGRDHPRLRTPEKRRAWVEEATERRLEKYLDWQDAIQARHDNKQISAGSDTNPVYPEWANSHYHGD